MSIDDLREYAGRYGVVEEPGLEIAVGDDGLILRLPGGPPDFDAPLKAGEGDHFIFADGPFAGAPVTFSRDERGAVAGIDVAGVPRMNLRAPDMVMPNYVCVLDVPSEEEQTSAFESLWETAVANGDGSLIAYELEYPKHEFLRYLVANKPVVLHGSNEPAVDIFEPRRRSVDGTDGGNKRAVYACSDGIWPIYFAIVDRKNYRGSLSNLAIPIENQHGQTARFYYFALGRSELSKALGPWIDGTIYIQPSESFVQTGGDLLPLEVASETPVKPLARLAVTPADFPFLGVVHGHDDTIDLRIWELTEMLYAECQEARPLDDGYALRYKWSPEWAAAVTEYIDLIRVWNPWRRFEIKLEPDGGPVWLTLGGSEALRDAIEHQLAEVGKAPTAR